MVKSTVVAMSGCSWETHVFVYGTLMRGEANHGLLSGARFLRDACSKAGFWLFDLGAFPAMVSGGGTGVHGEVYAIGPVHLQRLDRLEGHPHFYTRTDIELEDDTRALAYVLPRGKVEGARLLVSGKWRGRESERDGP